MALDLLTNLVSSLASLASVSLGFAVGVFLVSRLVGKPLHAFFRFRFKRSWIQSAVFTSLVVFFVILTFAYFYPVWSANQVSQIGPAPAELALTFPELLAQFVFGLVRVFLMSVLLAVLSLPLVFAGAFVFDSLKTRISSAWIRWFVASFVCVFLVFLIVLFLAPWIVPGLIYLFYWA